MSKPLHLTLGNTASLGMCYICWPLPNFQKQFTGFIYIYLLLILERKGKGKPSCLMDEEKETREIK